MRVKLALALFFHCPLINQTPLLLFYSTASSVFPSLVPVHASVSAVAEMFPISCMTTDTERNREGGWISAATADLPILFPTSLVFFFFPSSLSQVFFCVVYVSWCLCVQSLVLKCMFTSISLFLNSSCLIFHFPFLLFCHASRFLSVPSLSQV